VTTSALLDELADASDFAALTATWIMPTDLAAAALSAGGFTALAAVRPAAMLRAVLDAGNDEVRIVSGGDREAVVDYLRTAAPHANLVTCDLPAGIRSVERAVGYTVGADPVPDAAQVYVIRHAWLSIAALMRCVPVKDEVPAMPTVPLKLKLRGARR